MSAEPKECRTRARRCSELAAESSDPIIKKAFIDLAAQWVKLATNIEKGRTAPSTARSIGWQSKLARTILLKNGTELETLGDVRAFILNEPVHIQERRSWQRATELLIAAAESGHGIEGATEQVEDALFLQVRHVRP